MMGGLGARPIARRLLASLLLAVAIFFAVFLLPGLAVAPRQALSTIAANPGSILSQLAALFVVYGLPAWAVSFVALTLLNLFRPAVAVVYPTAGIVPTNETETARGALTERIG